MKTMRALLAVVVPAVMLAPMVMAYAGSEDLTPPDTGSKEAKVAPAVQAKGEAMVKQYATITMGPLNPGGLGGTVYLGVIRIDAPTLKLQKQLSRQGTYVNEKTGAVGNSHGDRVIHGVLSNALRLGWTIEEAIPVSTYTYVVLRREVPASSIVDTGGPSVTDTGGE